LLRNGIYVPEEWRYESEYKINYKFTDGEDKCTTAFILAAYKAIPPEYFEHDPIIKDEKFGMTVAHELACKGIIPPK